MAVSAVGVDGFDVPPSAPTEVATGPKLRSHMRFTDVLAAGAVGLRTRRLRTVLTAIGIAIGIAALVATMGISASSKADLIAELDALGTNKLEVRPGRDFSGGDATLPESTVAMIDRIGPVDAAAGVTSVSGSVRRNDHVPEAETNGISVLAADNDLLGAVDGTVADGRFLDDAVDGYPAIVLGATAAERLGIRDIDARPLVYVDGHWFAVVGILDPVPLLPGLDAAGFIGYEIAELLFETDRSPTAVYVRTDPDQVEAVQGVLAATANPRSPNEVEVTRPSDALAARDAVDDTLTALLLGLGAVALLVGGIGIANVMVIGVLERRTEIGVRRALGATKRHVRLQFLVEAVLLALLGGVIGAVLGVAVTAGYTVARNMVLSVPASSIAAGVGAALVVGAVAGLSPAGRAARLSPADAIRPA
jgi:putative ABC transport system permease protein